MERKIYSDITLRLMPGPNMPQSRRRGGLKITPERMRVLVVDEPSSESGIAEINPVQWAAIQKDAQASGLISYTVNSSADPNAPEVAALIAKLAAATEEIERLKKDAAHAADEAARLRAAFDEDRNAFRDKINEIDGLRQRAEGKVAELQSQIGLANQKGRRG